MNNFNPKVSIIVPVFNGNNYLRFAIESALSQTYTNKEIIVVDDGSVDSTAAIALSFGDKIRYVHKSNGGVSSALNLGIEVMTGDYFSWLSHDDVYHKDKISEQVRFLAGLANKDGVIVYGPWKIIDTKGEEILRTADIAENENLALSMLISSPLNGCTLLIPKLCFEVEGNFNEDLRHAQDVDLFYRFLRKFSFRLCPKYLVYMRHHRNQTTFRVSDGHLKESNDFLIAALKSASKEGLLDMSQKKRTLLFNWSRRGYKRATFYLIANCKYEKKDIIKAYWQLTIKLVKRRLRIIYAFR